jgi:hypothetical protein
MYPDSLPVIAREPDTTDQSARMISTNVTWELMIASTGFVSTPRTLLCVIAAILDSMGPRVVMISTNASWRQTIAAMGGFASTRSVHLFAIALGLVMEVAIAKQI